MIRHGLASTRDWQRVALRPLAVIATRALGMDHEEWP